MIYVFDDYRQIDEAGERALIARMDSARRRKALRYVRRRDRQNCCLAFALTCWGMQREHGINCIALGHNAYGKPHAVGTSCASPFFNWAHTDQGVACAVSMRPVGVDIEGIDARDLTIAPLFCDDAELRALADEADDAARASLMLQFWVVKEAYLKYLGVGFSLDPRCISALSLLAGAKPLVTVHIGRDVLVSCCSEEPLELQHVTCADLLSM